MYIQHLIGESGRRNKWTVKVAPAILVERCKERMAYHQDRLGTWKEARVKADSAVRARALKIETGGALDEDRVEPALARRLKECEQKVSYHQSEIERFLAFKAMCTLYTKQSPHAEPAMLDLNADDVLYFNLEEADSGREE